MSSAAGVAEMLNLMYGRELSPNLDHCLADLLTLATAFDIDLLHRYCESYIAAHLGVDNATYLLRLVNDFVCGDALRQLVRGYCKAHLASITQTLDWRYSLRNAPCHPTLANLIEEVITESRPRSSCGDRVPGSN